MGDQFCKSFALLPCRSDPWIRVTEPRESRINKFICRRGAPAASLSIKRPSENQLGRAVMLSRHPSEPMVDECRLPNASPGNDCNDMDVLIRPGSIQESDILLS